MERPKSAGEVGPSEAELVDIQLDSLEREYDGDFDCPVYEAVFSCSGPDGTATAYVTVMAEKVTTLEIVPRAMSDLHRLFAALAEQTRGWRVEEKR